MDSLKTNTRLFSLDLLRVLACIWVINQHACEFIYIGWWDGTGCVVNKGENTFWVGILAGLGRIAVPLFVMISGYFLLPLKDNISTFFRKRTTRVVYPFLFWCVAYAVYYVITRGDSMGTMWRNIAHIPVNYGTEVGHLWYVYMLLGLYMLVPILTPWLNSCSKRVLQGYLWVWVLTGLLPYVHKYLAPEVLGECFWNPSPMLHYFTGFAGFFVLGYYFKRFGVLGVKTSIALLLVGYAITAGMFCARIETTYYVPDLELSCCYGAINIAMMAAAVFSLVSRIKYDGNAVWARVLSDFSQRSYAIYLGHIMILNAVWEALKGIHESALVVVPTVVAVTTLLSYVAVRILGYLPYKKYWLG